VMYAGEVVERGSLNRVVFEPLHPYTEMLLSTILTLESPLKNLAWYSIASKDTFVAKELNACRYAGRCKYAFERCFKERPLLKLADKERLVACHKYN